MENWDEPCQAKTGFENCMSLSMRRFGIDCFAKPPISNNGI